MTLDSFTSCLRRLAGEYHRPPREIPREAIWSAIQEQRFRKRANSSTRPAIRWWRLLWWPAGAAAVLVGGIDDA